MKLPPETIRFRLGLHGRGGELADARSLSRLCGPFQLMARDDPRLELVYPPTTPDGRAQMDWHYLAGLDAVVLLDPYTQDDLRMVSIANACGTPVWSDYVDDLLNVRPSNPVWLNYSDRKTIKEHLTKIMRGSAVTTVTNDTLRQQLPLRDQIVVIPESCRWPMCDLPRRQVITWRGFGSHNEDLELVLPQLKEISHLPQFCNWDWVFLGEPYWKIFDGTIPKDRLVYVPPMTPYDLMNRWGGMAPFLHIAPLADHTFNRGKTPLAWLEATAIGAAVLGPDFPEWQLPGLSRYTSPEDFGVKLRQMMEQFNEGRFHPRVALSRHDIYPARTTRAVNELRWEVLNRIIQMRDRSGVRENAGDSAVDLPPPRL